MANRTAAAAFGRIFKLLSVSPTEDHCAIAKELLDEVVGCSFDFDIYQMECDVALNALGLPTSTKEYYGRS